MDQRGKLDIREKKEPTDRYENAILPVHTLWRKEPDVEAQEQAKRNPEERIRKGKDRVVRKVNLQEDKD